MSTIRIKDIQPNPFRNFDLYPFEEAHIERLQKSLGDLNQFRTIPVRKNFNGGYQNACSHHLIEALRRNGETTVEVTIENYSDDDMVAVMTTEDMTQRGHSAAAQNNSVAAYVRIVAEAILLGDKEDLTKFLVGFEDDRLVKAAQAQVAKAGPGVEIVYRAINRFDRKERSARKKDGQAEILSSTAIDASLAMLKSSGMMGQIVADALTEVEAIRAERDEKVRIEEEKRRREAERAEATRVKAEEKAKTEAERRERDAEKARVAAEEAKAKAKAAEGERKVKAEQEARDAEERRKQTEIERKAAEKIAKEEQEAREAERAAAKKQTDKERANREAEAEHRRKEREAVAAQKALDAIYDPRCVKVFRLASHEASFRKNVLSESGRKFIPLDQQYPLAQHVRADIDKIETKRRMDLGGVTIDGLVQDQITEAIRLQQGIDKEERTSRLTASAQLRVDGYWKTIARGLHQSEAALQKLVEEQKEWEWDKRLFPVHRDVIVQMDQMLHRFKDLRAALGLGGEEEEVNVRLKKLA